MIFSATPIQAMPAAHSRPGLGPSDSSDSASDLPAGRADTDSDTYGTGERETTDPDEREEDGADIGPDDIVDADQAGVSRSPANPVRNGGDRG